MEYAKIFRSKFAVYKKAVEGFNASLEIDLSDFDEIVQDSIKNGCIQKFEYCTELTWKIGKRFLSIAAGLEANSPKEVIKKLFTTGYIKEEELETLLNMIEDRNRLSHIYKNEYFEEILSKLKKYKIQMEDLINRIEQERI